MTRPEAPLAARTRMSHVVLIACAIAAFIAVAALASLLLSIAVEGTGSLSWKFLTSFASRKAANAGILAPLAGSVWVCAICALVAIPMGIGTALYLEEYAKRSRLQSIIQLNISNLAGVPSIVYGLLALAVFVRFFGFRAGEPPLSFSVDWSAMRMLSPGDPDSLWFIQVPFGSGVLAGGLTLALVVLPIMITASQEALRAVPKSLRQAAEALGSTRWQVAWRVTLPAALPTMMTGAILSISRALGEAAPLLVIGGFLMVLQTPTNLMSDFTVLPMQIYNWSGRPQEEFHRIAAAAIIVQLAVLLTFNALAIFVRQSFQKPLQS
ncbi:MAG: PstA family ABC transporter permease [Planctomycetota bacterium]|jgi:phosphate transport system permease protein